MPCGIGWLLVIRRMTLKILLSMQAWNPIFSRMGRPVILMFSP
jgi:hypothetical protein